jgi:hypothetical protein
VCSAVLSVAAVTVAVVLWVAELAETDGSPSMAGVALLITAALAGAGVPLLFIGPAGKYLPARDRRLAELATAALPAMCWLVACFPALMVVLGGR